MTDKAQKNQRKCLSFYKTTSIKSIVSKKLQYAGNMVFMPIGETVQKTITRKL